MSLNIGELVGYLRLDDSKFDAPLDRAQGRLGDAGTGLDRVHGKSLALGAVLGGVVGGGLALAAGKIKDFVVGSVDAFAAVEDATGAAGVQFKDQLPKVLAFADQAFASFGLSKRAALDAQNTFGTLGKAAGLEGPKLSGFSQQLTGLAGDMASFKGTSTEQAIDAVGAALRGEMEPIRAYGVLLDDATLRDQAMRMGLIKTTKDALTPQQKTLAAQAAILAQTADAQGDFARTSDSTANTQKRQQAATENASAALGQKLAPAVTAVRALWLQGILVFTSAIGVLDKVGQGVQAVSGFLNEHGTAVRIIVGLIAAVFLPHLIALGVQHTVTAAKAVWAWTTTQAGAVKAAAVHSVSVLKMIAGWVLMGVQSIANAGLVLVGFAMIGAGAVASAATTAAAWVAAQARTVASLVVMAAGFVVQGAVMVATTAVTVAAVVAGWVLMGVQSLIAAGRMAAAWLIAMGPVGWVIAAVIGLVILIVANWEKVKRYTAAAWNWVVAKLQAAATWIVGIFKRYHPVGIILGHWDQIKRGVSARVTGLISLVTGLPGRILRALGNLGDLLKEGGKDIIRGLIGGIRSMGGQIADVLVGLLPGPLKKFAGKLGLASPSKLFHWFGKMTGLGYVGGIRSTVPAVSDAMAAMVNVPVAHVTVPGGVRGGDGAAAPDWPPRRPPGDPPAAGTLRMHPEDIRALGEVMGEVAGKVVLRGISDAARGQARAVGVGRR